MLTRSAKSKSPLSGEWLQCDRDDTLQSRERDGAVPINRDVNQTPALSGKGSLAY